MSSTPKIVPLSTGEKVTFKTRITHHADSVFTETLRRGATYERDAKGKLSLTTMPELNFDHAVEAMLPLVIERIEKDGAEIEPDQEWLKGLWVKDYEKLYKQAMAIRKGTDDSIADGEKKD